MPEAVGTSLLARIDASSLLDAAPDALLVVDTKGNIRAANRLAPELFGYGPDELVTLSVHDLVPEPLRASHREVHAEYNEEPTARAMGVGLDLSALRADGTVVPVEISLSPVVIEGADFVIAAVRDVSAARAIGQELQRAQRDAILLEERQRMARDLHDTVIQEVFAVGLGLQSVVGHLEGLAATRISQAIDDLDRVIRDIRTAIFGVNSNQNWGSGVRGELLGVTADASRSLGFEPSVAFQGPVDDLSPEIAENLIPVLREALSNVAKHARARRCDIRVHAEHGELTLLVIDDGVGPDSAGPNEGGGLGLKNIDDRAESVGGSCSFGPADGPGSVLRWSVPIDGEDRS